MTMKRGCFMTFLGIFPKILFSHGRGAHKMRLIPYEVRLNIEMNIETNIPARGRVSVGQMGAGEWGWGAGGQSEGSGGGQEWGTGCRGGAKNGGRVRARMEHQNEVGARMGVGIKAAGVGSRRSEWWVGAGCQNGSGVGGAPIWYPILLSGVPFPYLISHL